MARFHSFIIDSFINSRLYLASTIKINITDTDKYLKTDGVYSDHLIFPPNLDNIDKVIEYRYTDFQLKDGAEIILVAQYNANTYSEEFDRLESLSYDIEKFESDRKYIVTDENKVLFNKRAYVCTYVSFRCYPEGEYEYACPDENTYTSTYIYLYYMSSERSNISEDLLPKIYSDNKDIYTYYSYNIYALSDDDEYNIWLSK